MKSCHGKLALENAWRVVTLNSINYYLLGKMKKMKKNILAYRNKDPFLWDHVSSKLLQEMDILKAKMGKQIEKHILSND